MPVPWRSFTGVESIKQSFAYSLPEFFWRSFNPKAVEDYKKGKQNALQFLVGQLMSKTRGKASPDLAQQILSKLMTKE